MSVGRLLGALLWHWLLSIACQFDEHLDVRAEVALRAHQDKGCFGAVPPQLGQPLLRGVVERGGAHHREAEQEHRRVGVAQGPQRVKVVLSGGVTELQSDRLVVDGHHNRVVVEGRRHVLRRIPVGCVAHDQARLAHGTVTDEDALDGADAPAAGCRRRGLHFGRKQAGRVIPRQRRHHDPISCIRPVQW
uniref:Putative secreted protein n=1 Tax=Ixodes ricinus TaxID=34613 RepID=A0A6B0V192_IXORI